MVPGSVNKVRVFKLNRFYIIALERIAGKQRYMLYKEILPDHGKEHNSNKHHRRKDHGNHHTGRPSKQKLHIVSNKSVNKQSNRD